MLTTEPGFDPTLLSRIEDAGLNASAPPQQRWVDGWLLRFSPGKAKRARCINAVADGRMPLIDRLALCRAVFAASDLPLLVRLTPFTRPPALDAALAEMGMSSLDDTRVMVLSELRVIEPRPAPQVEIRSIPLAAFAQCVGQMRGSPLAQRQAHAERLLGSPVGFQAYELRVEGHVLACGQYALEADLVGLYDVYTVPTARGRGLASQLCTHLLNDARSRGASHAYLQVEADNQAARTVYQRLGFADAYGYHYRVEMPEST
ncbi:MAG: GNAT family N-acetyltransferase [Burkholderiaceae bacterium]